MNTTIRIRFLEVLLCLVLVGSITGTASAVTTFNMAADQTTLTMPDGEIVNMWGFGLTSTNVNGTVTPGDGVVKVPGNPLVVPPGETTVTINLTNNLPEPVSLMILGQSMAAATGPVWTDGLSNTISATGSRTAGDFSSRVRSFAHETPAGGVASYTWTNFRAGTYLLQSGTNPAKQVQMGLYAAVKKDHAPGQAYSGVAYTHDFVMVYSEVDPAMHAAISGGTYGPGETISSSLQREPKYFLINGMAFDPAAPGGLDPVAFVDGLDKVLIRVINAGYELHVPEFANTYVSLVAEDGNLRAYPTQQYSLEMPAGKIYDVMLKPAAAGRYAVHDAALHLTNNGSADPGGMLAYYGVACVGDADQNGSVNVLDLALVRNNFGAGCAPGGPCPGDVNKDYVVNILDRVLVRNNFGLSGCPVAP